MARITNATLLQMLAELETRVAALEQKPTFKVPEVSDTNRISRAENASSPHVGSAAIGGTVDPVALAAVPPPYQSYPSQYPGSGYGYHQQQPGYGYGQHYPPQQTGTLYDNFIIRSMIIYLPMDWQVLVTNMLYGLGHMKMWKALLIIAAFLIAGMSFGIISTPASIIARVQSLWNSTVCDAPSTNLVSPATTYSPVQ